MTQRGPAEEAATSELKSLVHTGNFVGDVAFLTDAKLAHKSRFSEVNNSKSFACHSFDRICKEEKNRRQNGPFAL